MHKITKSNFFILILIVVLCFPIFMTDLFYGAKTPTMYSGAYALTDGSTGRLLHGKNENNPMANASTTKILTCIVTLENSNITDVVTISSNASNQPKVRLGMGEGEQYSLIDLLYGLMLESYNDCAVAIAEHVAGSEEEFSELLNIKAKDIGCVDTYFITPNGLDEENDMGFHHTTALDLCKIMEYCAWISPQCDMFLKITQTSSYQGNNGKNNYSFSNKNALLHSMEGLVSGKTGFTSKAGYCYVAAYEKDGERYCIALLACGWPNNKTYKWQDAKALLGFALNTYNPVVREEEKIKEFIYIDGYIDTPSIKYLNQTMKIEISGKSSRNIILLSKEEVVQRKILLDENIKLPIVKGENLGSCFFYVDDYLIETIPLIANYNVGEWDYWKILYVLIRDYVDF